MKYYNTVVMKVADEEVYQEVSNEPINLESTVYCTLNKMKWTKILLRNCSLVENHVQLSLLFEMFFRAIGAITKQICTTVGPSLATSLEPFAHRRNVASLSLFYRNYFGRFSSELAQLVPLPFFRGIPRCYQDVFVNSFFPRTARLWNPLPIECFPLTYDLNCFKSRINRHLFTVGFFEGDFLYALIFLYFFFL